MSDITIFIIDREGIKHKVVAPTDMNMNLMEVCKSYELPVEGTCGGMAMCASCQVYILDQQFFGEKNDNEEAMLSEAFHVQKNSRLGCQILITEDLNGMTVQLAPEV